MRRKLAMAYIVSLVGGSFLLGATLIIWGLLTDNLALTVIGGWVDGIVIVSLLAWLLHWATDEVERINTNGYS